MGRIWPSCGLFDPVLVGRLKGAATEAPSPGGGLLVGKLVQQHFVNKYQVRGARAEGEAGSISLKDKFLGRPCVLKGGLGEAVYPIRRLRSFDGFEVAVTTSWVVAGIHRVTRLSLYQSAVCNETKYRRLRLSCCNKLLTISQPPSSS